MASYAMITAVGTDRSGIVASVTDVLFQSGCNIHDSASARLGQQFTMMLLVELPGGMTAHELDGRLAPLSGQMKLDFHVIDIRPEEAAESTPDQAQHVITVHGPDRKGLVHQVTSYLAARSVNIVELNTFSEPELSQYTIHIGVTVPPFVPMAQLTDELVQLGQTMNVQVTVAAADA